jgi:hypothetical protein
MTLGHYWILTISLIIDMEDIITILALVKEYLPG